MPDYDPDDLVHEVPSPAHKSPPDSAAHVPTSEGSNRHPNKTRDACHLVNLGSGDDYRKGNGWWNVDLHAEPRDQTVDLWDPPWDLPSDHYNVALLRDVLEHAPPTIGPANGVVAVLREVHRILHDEGTARIMVPYAGSRDAYKNVDHYHHFNQDTFPHLLTYHPSDLPLKLAHQEIHRRIRFGDWFDSWYHVPKYTPFGKPTGVGRKARLIVELEPK